MPPHSRRHPQRARQSAHFPSLGRMVPSSLNLPAAILPTFIAASHQRPATGAESNISASRARVAAVVPSGRARSAASTETVMSGEWSPYFASAADQELRPISLSRAGRSSSDRRFARNCPRWANSRKARRTRIQPPRSFRQTGTNRAPRRRSGRRPGRLPPGCRRGCRGRLSR